MKLATFAALLLLASCMKVEPTLVVDQCALLEYQQECETTVGGELGTPEELEACMDKAKREAVRIRAGVPSQCRPA